MSASIGSTAPGDAMIGDSWPRMGGYTIDIYIYTKHFFLSIFPQNLTLAQFDVYVYIYTYQQPLEGMPAIQYFQYIYIHIIRKKSNMLQQTGQRLSSVCVPGPLVSNSFYDDPKTFGTIHDSIVPIMPIIHHCTFSNLFPTLPVSRNSNQKVVKPLCAQFPQEPPGPDESQSF